MLAALLLAAAAPHPVALAGLYNGGQMELAATLVLRPDGHFGYALSYGALDEEASGTWEAEGNVVRLTTLPAVVPPQFVVERDTPDIMGGFTLILSNAAILRGTPLRALLFYAPDEPPIASEVAADGRVVLPDSRRPNALLPLLPVYPPKRRADPAHRQKRPPPHRPVRAERYRQGRFPGRAAGHRGRYADPAALRSHPAFPPRAMNGRLAPQRASGKKGA